MTHKKRRVTTRLNKRRPVRRKELLIKIKKAKIDGILYRICTFFISSIPPSCDFLRVVAGGEMRRSNDPPKLCHYFRFHLRPVLKQNGMGCGEIPRQILVDCIVGKQQQNPLNLKCLHSIFSTYIYTHTLAHKDKEREKRRGKLKWGRRGKQCCYNVILQWQGIN